MNKILKIILINILLFCLFFLCIEAFLFYSFKKKNPSAIYSIKIVDYKKTIKKSFPREPVGLQYTKRPIMLTGCSYIYGLFLEGEHTPQYKLSELAKRPVFNYALPGKGLQHALYIIKNQLYDDRMKNPEYIIYVMMLDHIRRMYSTAIYSDTIGQPVFDIDKNGIITLKSDNYPFYKKFYTYYLINNIIYSKYYAGKTDILEREVLIYFKEMNRLIKKQFPDIKFVIVLYDDYNNFNINFSELEKDGFIVLQTKKLTGVSLETKEYQVSDTDIHPNEAAWDIIIPALAKKLKL